ncbi:MAG: hypothetical protein ACI9FN_002370 [Saprospiraceae bacterium]|jgi:hypothetical protein
MKLKHLVVLLTLAISIAACDGTKPTVVVKSFVPPTVDQPIGKGLNIDAIASQRGGLLTSARTIVPIEYIAAELGKTVQDIVVKDSSPGGPGATHSSCFFKWSDFEVNNAGLLIQIMINPLGDEYPEYVEKFISSKKSLGEQDTEGEKILFQTLQGIGDDGAYSYEAGKYFWRLGDKVIMSIAFNSAHSEEGQYRIATSLAKQMINNYVKG